MNGKQLLIVGLGIAIVAAMVIFPPFNWVQKSGDDTLSAGYRWVWNAPEDPRWDGRINLLRLGFQVFVVMAFTAFGVEKLNKA